MKIKSAGITFIVLGILLIGYTSFNFVTTEKVVDLGPLKIEREKNHFFHWPPVVGGLLVLGGIVLLVSGRKNTD